MADKMIASYPAEDSLSHNDLLLLDDGNGNYTKLTISQLMAWIAANITLRENMVASTAIANGAVTSEKLASAVIDKLALAGGIAANSEGYAQTTRSVNIDGFKLVLGALVTVRFTYKLKASTQLRVSADGGTTYTAPKPIYLGNAEIGEDIIKAGSTVTMRYDGNYYRIIAMTPCYIAPGAITAEMLADGAKNVDNVVYFTAEVTGATNMLSQTTAADIAYQIAGLGKNVVYCFVDPSDNGLAFMDAKPTPPAADVTQVTFSRLDVTNSRIVWYTLYTDGTIAKGTTPIDSSSSSSGITTLPQLGGGYAESGGTGNSASTVARKATISGYVLTVGNGPTIKFTNGITATNPTFNVNNGTSDTGAKPIWYRGAALPPGVVENGALVKLVYDGAHYCIESIDNAPTIWGFDSASQYGSYGSTVAVGDYVMYPVSGRLHLFRKASGGLTDLWTFPAFYIKSSNGIPAADLASDAKPLIVHLTASGNSYTSDVSETDILAAAAAGQTVVMATATGLAYYIGDDGDDDTAFYGFAKSGTTYYPVRYVVSGTSVTRTMQTYSGSGVSWASAPTAQQAGYILVANNDGTASWVSISSLLTAWTPNNPYGGGN